MRDNPWLARWTRDQVAVLLHEQFDTFWRRDTGTERDQLADLVGSLSSPHAVIVSGLRRAGKSTLLAQLAHRLGEGEVYYVNFEDERFLGFTAADANDLRGLLVEMFGERDILVMDEIQNVPDWERFVRRFMDMGIKFYLTGSNASLLSQDLGTRLTGRYLPVELLPFSFGEFLRFQGATATQLPPMTTVGAARLRGRLDKYLRLGGLPEVLTYPELPLARTLYDDVIYRDIATRHRIADVRALKELAYFLMSNPAGLVSFNKLKAQLGLGSVNTVRSYITYLENSWLLFTTNLYDFSVKRQQVAPKKVYAIDTGLANAVGFAFSPNTGRLLENLVFLALRRYSREIYYHTSRAGFEVDFYLPESRQLIQVAQSLAQPEVRAREVRAVAESMRELGLTRGLILTDIRAEPIEVEGGTIEVRALGEWLLAT